MLLFELMQVPEVQPEINKNVERERERDKKCTFFKMKGSSLY